MSFLQNAVEHPKTSLTGLVVILGSLFAIVGLIKNPAAITPQNITAIGSSIVTGVGLLFASDASGQKVAAVTKEMVETAEEAAPAVLNVVKAYKAQAAEAAAAKTKLDNFTALTTALASALTPPSAPEPETAPEPVKAGESDEAAAPTAVEQPTAPAFAPVINLSGQATHPTAEQIAAAQATLAVTQAAAPEVIANAQ